MPPPAARREAVEAARPKAAEKGLGDASAEPQEQHKQRRPAGWTKKNGWGCPRKRKRSCFNVRKGKKKQAMPRPAVEVTPPSAQDPPPLRPPPDEEFESDRKKGKGRKGRRAAGGHVTHCGAPAIVLATKPRECACPRAPTTSPAPSKPAAVIAPSPFPRYTTKRPTISNEMRRVATTTYSLEGMEASPENKDAKSAAWIAKELNIPHGSREQIKAVIRKT